MNAVGLKSIFEERVNPLPWINHWLDSDSVQVAPQETEITAYLVSAIAHQIKHMLCPS
jgi:ribonucleoside-diphosphate reductase beta chain